MIHNESPGPSAGFFVFSERLSLRHFHEDDAAWMHAIYSQPDVARYLLDEPWSKDDAVGKVAERMARRGIDTPARALALVVEYHGTPVGDVVMWLTDHERPVAEVGWVLDPEFQGLGIAHDAVQWLLAYAIQRHGLHRVAAQMDARNAASARLALSVGMRQEAHLRGDSWNKGEWTDTLIFGLLAADRA